jgi:hypothetical protein
MSKFLHHINSKPIHKKLKVIAIVFFTLLLIYGGLRIYLNHILKRVVIEQVAQFADKNYKLELNNIDIGWWAYNANVTGFKLTKIENKLSTHDQFHFTISASSVKLKGLYLFDLLFYKNLDLRKLELKDPTIAINYNDTIATKANVDSSLSSFKFKLSKIELLNANITVNKSSGEKLSLNSDLIDYSFKNKLLHLKAINLNRKNSSLQKNDFLVFINDALLSGFNLNALMNDGKFKYDDCRIDKLLVEVKANETKSATTLTNTSKNENILFDKIKPIKINRITFSYFSTYDSVITSAHDFYYKNQNLHISNIKAKLRQKHLITAAIKEIEISGFNIDHFIAFNHSKIGKIKLTSPQLNIKLFIQKNYELAHPKTLKKRYFAIDVIDTFEIENGGLLLQHKKYLHLQSERIKLYVLGLNPNFNQETLNKAIANQMIASVGKTKFNFPNNLYHLDFNNFNYNLKKESLMIDDIKINPNYKKSEFHAKVKKQIAMINLHLKTLNISGINVNNLVTKNSFTCNEINASTLKVNFYKDKNIPLLESDYKKFPQELLYDINYPININKLLVKETALVSEILNPGASKSAKFIVNNVKAEINHIHNKQYQGNQMHVKFEGKIAGAGLLKATAMIDMYDNTYKHTIHATLGRMPFHYLNDFMFDFAGVEINKGTLDSALIDISGNNQKINCKLTLAYHDLSMDILRNQNKKNKRYRNIASILANSIIYDHNPEFGKPIRNSVVEQSYISNKFIVGNWINICLKAMLLTTAPKAANALQISNKEETSDSILVKKSPNWLKKLINRKKVK